MKMSDLITGIDTGDVSVEEVNDIDTFRLLKDSWNELLQQCPDNDIFLTWEWLFHWWKYHGDDKKLRILLIKERDNILGIAPFMQSTYHSGLLSVNALENICAINCDRSGIVYGPDNHKVAVALLKHLEKLTEEEKIIVRISHVPENSGFATLLWKSYREFADSLIIKKRVISTCPYIVLPETWEDYRNHYCPSKKRMKTLRYSLRALQRDRTVELKEFDGDDDSLKSQLQILFELHKNRWLAETGKSKFTERRTCDFYFEVSKVLRQNGWLSFTFLNVDGKPASIIWGFKYNNAWMDMTPVFNPEYSKFSVGQIQIMKIIESAIREGLHKCDFLKGGSEYKSRWTSSSIDNLQITIIKGDIWAKYRVVLLNIIIKLQNIRGRSFRENITLLLKKLRYR